MNNKLKSELKVGDIYTFRVKRNKVRNIKKTYLFQEDCWRLIKEYANINSNIRKYYCERFMLNKTDLSQWVYKYCSKKIKKFIEALDEDDGVECCSIQLFNRNICYYDDLLLIDINEGYAPYINTMINTSSTYAMWKGGLYEDEEDDEDNNNLTMTEIVNLVNPIFRKGLKNTLIDYKERETNYNNNNNSI